MPVPLLDLTRQYASIQGELEAAALSVLRSCRYIGGPEVEALERELSRYVGARHGVALSSGTDALLAVLMALGVGEGDEVVTTDYSFFATAGTIRRLSARPVFVDIDPVTKNMDPEGIERALTPRTRAVIVVHLYGRAADTTAISEACKGKRIPIIEDAAQAIGARLRGANVGTLGEAACFSFFPSKNLAGAGDGGFLTTDDEGLAAKVRCLRNHGQSDTYRHEIVGANFRLDALQAAILRVKLGHLEEWTAARRRNAARYARILREKRLDGIVRTPPDDPDRHVYHQYVVDVPDRDRVMSVLKERGIGCAVYYPLPFHRQPCFATDVQGQGPFPESDACSSTGLALPIFPELTDSEAEEVVDALAAALTMS